MAPFERAMVVSYRISIVTIALSVTIRPQFAIECLRRSNQHGVGHFGPKFPGVPLGVDPWYLGPQRANIPGKLTVKIFSKNSNLCDHNPPTSQTDRRTDRQTTCDRKTALCTKVHRAVKKTTLISLELFLIYYEVFDQDISTSRTHFVHFAAFIRYQWPWISLRGHLRSLIFAPIESAYMTSQ